MESMYYENHQEDSFRMEITFVIPDVSGGAFASGIVEKGIVRKGDILQLKQSNGRTRSLKAHDVRIKGKEGDCAVEGDHAGVRLGDILYTDVQKGDILEK